MLIVTDSRPRVDATQILGRELVEQINHHTHHYPQKRAAVLDALKAVQKVHGWVNDTQLAAGASLLEMAVADVEGVATFYNRIYRQSVGRHVILVCDSIACFLTGYEELAGELQAELGVEFGQTTADQRFTLLPIVCLGNCDKGPSLMIDEDTHGPIKPGQIKALLESYA